MSRKRGRNTTNAPLDAPHIDDWQARARALGWPQREIDSAQTMVVLGGHRATTRVTFVGARVIEMVTLIDAVFGGTNRDGIRVERVVQRAAYFAWKREEKSDGNNTAQSSYDPDSVNTAIACDILIANDACTPVAAAAKPKREKRVLVGQRSLL